MKALVTGVAGFIGSHLAEALVRDGHEVVGVDRFSDYYAPAIKETNLAALASSPRFRLERVDLADAQLAALLDGVSHVFHCAAQAGVRASWGSEFEQYARDNVLATQRLLEAARRVPLARFVYASSSSVYGNARALPVTEDAPPEPISPYGITKLAAERLGVLYGASYGVPFVSLRLFTVYGPRQRPDMAFHRFLSALSAGRPLEVYGDGTQTRDFTYVADAVGAFVAAAARDGVVGQAINVAGGTRIALRDAIDIAGQVAGRKPEVRWLPKGRGDADHTDAAIEKARRLLGFAPRTALREGLTEQLHWIRAHAGGVRVEG
jgi:UDP-glucose 4-epimerase